MRKRNRKFRLSWRRVISWALAVLLIAGAIAGVAALTEHVTDDQKTVHPTFERGSIDAKTGIPMETDGALYTAESFVAKGLQIKLDFDAHLSYQIFWYNAQDQFAYATDVYKAGGEHFAPPNYRARIVLTPNWNEIDDEDQEISWYEIWDYANRIEIRIDKNQTIKYTEYDLTDVAIFDQTATGGVIDPITGEKKETADYSLVSSFAFKNDGVCSSLYFATEGIEQDILHVRVFLVTGDGQEKLYYFNEMSEMNEERAGYIPTEDNPLYIPEGYGVCIFMNTHQVNPENVKAYLY